MTRWLGIVWWERQTSSSAATRILLATTSKSDGPGIPETSDSKKDAFGIPGAGLSAKVGRCIHSPIATDSKGYDTALPSCPAASRSLR